MIEEACSRGAARADEPPLPSDGGGGHEGLDGRGWLGSLRVRASEFPRRRYRIAAAPPAC
jgi:hypothetical protein